MQINSKYSILLKTAIVFYCLFFCCYLFTPFTFNTETVYNDFVAFNFITELIIIAVFAPIIEELIFRAPIIFNTKKWNIFFLLLCVGFLAFSFSNIDLRSLLFTLWLCIVVVSRFIIKKGFKNVLIWSSIFAFSLSHLTIESFFNFNSLVQFVFFFASSCLLTWVALNYGLLKTVLFHSMYNLISFLIYLLVLNYAFDGSLKKDCIESQKVCIEWQQKPIFKSSLSKIENKNNILNATNAKVKNVLDLLTTLDLEKYEYVIVNDNKIKYDIKITIGDNKKLNDSVIISSLEKSGLIKVIEKDIH